MGLTINYSASSNTKSAARARQLVDQMRQLALALPFQEVGEIVSLEGEECDVERQRGTARSPQFWLVVQGCHYLDSPWNEQSSQTVTPTRMMAFNIKPGPGCEPANLGLCTYPNEIQCEYRPTDDSRFTEEYQPFGPGSTGRRFSRRKWERWLKKNGHDRHLSPDDERFVEARRIKTGLTGWRWESFTKTQYASHPACGGMANFLRCHISIVTLLERIAKLPTMQVEINDDGKYGPYRHAEDLEEARSERREPNFVWRKGHYDPKALVAEIGKWNGIVAAFAGALKDAGEKSGMAFHAPIQSFPDFEQLEFRGSQDERLQSFLQSMREWAEKQLRKHANDKDENEWAGDQGP